VLKSVIWVRDVDVGPTLRGAAVVLGVMALPLMVVAAVPFWSAATAEVEERSAEVYADDNQGETRLNLWREAVEKGIESGLAGYGPGPHLTSKSYKRPPPDKFEAHNTSLDLFTQGGLVALLAFVWLAASTLVTGWRARLPALVALTAGIAVFSMFHFVVRHPIFWFGIVLCLLESARTPASRDRDIAGAIDREALP
jgi:O-antigen ligase